MCSGGTTLCDILQTIEGYPLSKWGFASVPGTHVIIEAERRAYADRNTDLGDPAFIKNPVATLISDEHAATLRASILPNRPTPSSENKGRLRAAEGPKTPH